MLPVNDEIICKPGELYEKKSRSRARTEVAQTKPQNRKLEESFKDDSFMDDINWNAVSSKSMFFKGQSFRFFSPGDRAATLKEELPELYKQHSTPRSRFASSPALTQYVGGDRSEGSDETNHHYPMTKITETLYLGNDHDASDEAALKKAKITHVLSMIARNWSSKPRGLFNWMSKGIKRKCVPMRDDGNSDVAKILEEKGLWNFILDSQRRKKKILVHCQMGMNRSPTIVMGFLMKYDDITFYKAWRLVKQKRVIVQPHVNYIKQLRALDMYIHGSYSTPCDFLQMKVSEGGISVLHENTDTKRMNDVLVASTKKLKDESTLNIPMVWESDLDISPTDEKFTSTRRESTNFLSVTFSDSELKIGQNSTAL